ncbi:CGNR zinc finger domain-containing protein [Mycolicibacterium flavescens]|uniref:RNA-binding protein n=1 Tax=Mycolicibacterium flavescens TaxID=1776 RepID=A0A1E3RA25_MYCFV|nr:CGNR zinc finger domain-containing protein [Mycolicibacterium flavescens]MCV7279070.1 CGNR zinc finger domain-containing protein [Mycolicibacterium flavescens]ODQ86790.1 RNA-binding protein [Mycolicibacterium flavescens]
MSVAPREWLGDTETKPAPPGLARVQSLINTVELPVGPDRLAHADDARPWLQSQELLAADEDVDDADLRFLRDVREAFRAMVIHNSGGPAPTPEALAPLRAVTAGSVARAEIGDDGQVGLAASAASLRDRVLGLLLAVRDAQRDGTWPLLKACANDECLWAFYDRSRNRGGTWCSMATCGNKLKNREFRARRRSST